MDAAIARDIARRSHDGQLTRHGWPMTDHVERVAAAVDDDERAVPFLHDVLEKTDTSLDDLRKWRAGTYSPRNTGGRRHRARDQ